MSVVKHTRRWIGWSEWGVLSGVRTLWHYVARDINMKRFRFTTLLGSVFQTELGCHASDRQSGLISQAHQLEHCTDTFYFPTVRSVPSFPPSHWFLLNAYWHRCIFLTYRPVGCVEMDVAIALDRRNHNGTEVHGFVNPYTELNAGLWALFAGATVLLALRLWVKVTRRHGLWYDDYVLILSWVSYTWITVYLTAYLKSA